MANKSIISIIAAMTDDRVIGRDNKLPWHISEDMARFKNTTMGHPVIMGRKTFESMESEPLEGRTNIVLSRKPDYKPEGVLVAKDLKEAIKLAEVQKGGQEIFVIGGAGVFKEALLIADKLYLTMVHMPFPGDVYFPKINYEKDFSIIHTQHGQNQKDPNVKFTFLTVLRGLQKKPLMTIDGPDLLKSSAIFIALIGYLLFWYGRQKTEISPRINSAVFTAIGEIEHRCASEARQKKELSRECQELSTHVASKPAIKNDLESYYGLLRHCGFEMPPLHASN